MRRALNFGNIPYRRFIVDVTGFSSRPWMPVFSDAVWVLGMYA